MGRTGQLQKFNNGREGKIGLFVANIVNQGNLKTERYETNNLIDEYTEIFLNLTNELNHFKWQGDTN